MPSFKPEGRDFSESVVERGKKFGLWLREGMARKNINNKELATLTRISAAYIGILAKDCYDQSKDRVIRPGQDKIRRIAAALGISPAIGLDAAGWKATAEDLQLFALDTETLYTFVTTRGVVMEFLARDEEFKQTLHLALLHAKKRAQGH